MQLNETLRDTYFCKTEDLIEELNSDDAAVVRAATDRMICACNRQMMEDRANVAEARTTPVAKRKPEPVAVEEEEPSTDSVVDALRATFAV